MAEKVEVLVDGGKATPGQPLGPVLGPLGVNVIQVVAAINEKTKAFSALIMKELGIEKGSGKPKTEKVGDLSLEQAKKIALMKQEACLGRNLKKAAKEIVGACVSMGVTVEGKDPREVQHEIDEGKHDDLLSG